MLRSLIKFRRDHSIRSMDIPAVRHMQSQERLHALIHRERARADRSGRPFTVVSFRLDPRKVSRRNLLRLAHIAMDKSRITDDVGWFARNTVAALLPETETPGAWTYANRVADVYEERVGLRPEITVFEYPSNWSNRREGRPEEREGRKVVRVAKTGGVMPDQPMPQPVTVRSVAMEPLFVKPMPIEKRALDIVVASIAITMALPVMVAAAIAVKVTSPGPVIFRQNRAGLGGVPFTMFKFRSMYQDAEHRMEELRKHNEMDGPVFKIKNDPRITPVGRFLRKTSIDELPQLFNVLIGDMSLVGPRPPIIKETHEYESWQFRRLEVTPGITCIWQVSGRNGVDFEEWMRMDSRYAIDRSLWTDLKILAKTVPAVLWGRGAS